jgi:CRISPR type III-A-associated RAMP protein Csm4
MNFDIVRLHFKQPIHLSRGKLNTYESSEHTLHSDTLQAALFVSALQLYNEATANEFKEKVRISSAFPWTAEHGYWLPKPISLRLDDHPDTRKELKKIKYLRKLNFEQAIQGNEIPQLDLLEGTADGAKAIQPKIWYPDTTQRVVLDRINTASTPFYLEKLYPFNGHRDCGLYLLLKNEGFDKLKNLFRLLGDNGIGLQRSLGNGTFEPVFGETMSIESPKTHSSWVSLSLFRPESEAKLGKIKLEHSQYHLLKRGGWLASPEDALHMSLRKKSVLMFSEGSVLDFGDDASQEGGFSDLKPFGGHPIWRDGRGFFLPMK